MKECNGHRSWSAWNVSLWIHNDHGLYTLAQDCVERSKTKAQAVSSFLKSAPRNTPDGATFSRLAVGLAISEMWSSKAK